MAVNGTLWSSITDLKYDGGMISVGPLRILEQLFLATWAGYRLIQVFSHMVASGSFRQVDQRDDESQ
jgi:hypothetical protein